MAKIQLQNFLKKIIVNNNTDKNKPKKIKLYNKLTSLTKTEFDNIKSNFFIPTNQNTINNNISIDNLNNIFIKTYNQIIESKLNYEKLCTLEPKIEQAETIIIPSILSPNSLKNYNLSFTFSDKINKIIKESPDLAKEILDKINTFINNDLQLHEKIDNWLRESLFSVGSKAILIIPPKVISNLRDDTISFEEYEDQFIDENLIINSNDILKDALDNTITSLESINETLVIDNDLKDNKYNDKILFNLTTTIAKEVQQNISISDKIEYITYPKKSNQSKYKSFIEKYNAWYHNEDPNLIPKIKTNDVLNITDFINDNDDNTSSHPLLLEIPSESLLPIIDKNNPSLHYCYLMLLDENHNPLNIDSNIDNNISNINNSLTISLINKLYNSSMNNKSDISNSYIKKNINDATKYKIVQSIYQKYIDNIILSSTKRIGITNVNFEMKNNILKTMFYRLLKHKKTKLVIIPNFLLTYIAFKYDNNGIGISKTKEISFILSMKLTYIITRLYKMIDQGIDTKDIKVSLNKKINNPLEFLQSLKDVLVQNKVINFSYDPNKIIKDITNRHINIISNNIPGIENFEIDKENKQASHNMVDTELIEILDNMLTILLEVPPSAYNELSENEYARSLTTINLLFDLKMSKKRKILSNHISRLIQNYFMFDYKFQKDLNNFLIKKLNIVNKNNKITDLINNIISSLQLTLPESNIAFDEAEFESANKYIDFVNNLIENIFSKDLITNSDNQDFFEKLTTHIKSNMIKKYLSKSNLILHVDDILTDIESFNIDNVLDLQKLITNFKKVIDDYSKKIGKTEENSRY